VKQKAERTLQQGGNHHSSSSSSSTSSAVAALSTIWHRNSNKSCNLQQQQAKQPAQEQ